ncbi:MAG: hypothetical protein K0R00_92 [Herbinix sp.]|jgi:DNA-directed RNA polymerase subunit RPC12/RpoP|nr:hypothetical protein [Herbinix sp.]
MDNDKQKIIIHTKGKRFSLDLEPTEADDMFFALLKTVVTASSDVNSSPMLKELFEQHRNSSIVSTKAIEEGSASVEDSEDVPSNITEACDETQSRLAFVDIPYEIKDEIRNRDTETQTVADKVMEQARNAGNRGYRGFVMIRCKHCGAVKATALKDYLTTFKCRECGTETELENLKTMYVNCECGGRYRYQTNFTADDTLFDVDCLGCNSPVTVRYNSNSETFQSLNRY